MKLASREKSGIHMYKKQEIKSKMAFFFMSFIILQPILDILTTLSIYYLQWNLTIGIIVRFLTIVISGLFLLLNYKENKQSIYYLILLAVILTLSLMINYFVKSPFNLIGEVTSIGKIVYFIIMLLTYIGVFNLFKKQANLENRFLKAIVYSTMIITLSMVIAIFTNTSLDSYQYMKFGYKGWFYAANELGTILAIIFPLILWFSIKKSTNINGIIWWGPTILSIFSLLMIGTKVGYGAVLLMLPIASGAIAFERILNKNIRKIDIINFFIPILLASTVIYVTPKLSIVSNIESHIELIGEQNKQTRKRRNNYDDSLEDESQITEKDLANELIYSGRNSFLKEHQDDFNAAPVGQKIFGMGHGSNYDRYPKMIERDFHDIFYQFGILGFISIMLPIALCLLKICRGVIINFKKMFAVKYIMLFSSLALGFGIAFVAGHVFTSPAVSIYLSIVLAFLYRDFSNKEIIYKTK